MALTTNTVTHTHDVDNRVVGRVVTDAGAAADTTFTLGFTPRYVEFVNLTDRITNEWYHGMAADSALKTIATGVRTLETSAGITVTEGGFTVPAAMILASKTFAFIAHN